MRTIKSAAVWEAMAHMCIRNKRLDVAEHCLGKMENARGARAAREAASIPELDARVATVAVHLNMVEDAKKLYVSCGRYDLLNQLYRACGQWDKAIEVAERQDRIHLSSTHYAYAQHLERLGLWDQAVAAYERSGTHLAEVPRMMYEAGKLEELEAYVVRKGDRGLVQWWARFCESKNDLKRALAMYEKAGDTLALVRLHCFRSALREAEAAVNASEDAAAAFHLARHFEAHEMAPEAVRYYAMSKRYSHGVRLAKRYNLAADLMQLALRSTPTAMIDTADYLMERGEHEKAAMLYMKGGRVRKAVDMCFSANLFDVLQNITDTLQPGDDPDLIARCAEFFLQHDEYAKAVKMFIAARQHAKALDLVLKHEVRPMC